MVAWCISPWLLLAVDSVPVDTPAKPGELPEPVRQIAYMALLGIALLGMLMIVGTLLGGHWVRRWGDHVRRRSVPADVIIPRAQAKSSQADVDSANDGDTLGGNDTTIVRP